MSDPAFGEKQLERLEAAFDRAEVVRLRGVGHFPQEEAAGTVLPPLRGFLAGDADI